MLFNNIRGILFDVDGTLYNQRYLRYRMIVKLLKFFLINPKRTYKEAKIVYFFRKNRELLRYKKESVCPLKELQYIKVAEHFVVPVEEIKTIIKKWIYLYPFDYLKDSMFSNLESFLDLAKKMGLKLGVFSDYPAQDKLRAMGIDRYFDLVISADDIEINAFKPSFKGIEMVLSKWNLAKHELIYVGDREIDRMCAEDIGVKFIKIGSYDSYYGEMNYFNLERTLVKDRKR